MLLYIASSGQRLNKVPLITCLSLVFTLQHVKNYDAFVISSATYIGNGIDNVIGIFFKYCLYRAVCSSGHQVTGCPSISNNNITIIFETGTGTLIGIIITTENDIAISYWYILIFLIVVLVRVDFSSFSDLCVALIL